MKGQLTELVVVRSKSEEQRKTNIVRFLELTPNRTSVGLEVRYEWIHTMGLSMNLNSKVDMDLRIEMCYCLIATLWLDLMV